MKKIALLLLVLAFIICGCGKSEEPPAVVDTPGNTDSPFHKTVPVGEVPEEFEIIVAHNLFCGVTAYGDRLLQVGNPYIQNVIKVYDTRGEEIMEKVLSLKDHEKIAYCAITEDGREACLSLPVPADTAREPERMLQTIREQLGKRSAPYAFQASDIRVEGPVPFFPTSALNGLRRDLAAQLDRQPVNALPLYRGVRTPDTSFRLEYASNGELMRSKYCIRHELGLCPKQGKVKKAEPLFLRNGKERLQLSFDCAVCEMTVS